MQATWSLSPLPWESEFLQRNLWRLTVPAGTNEAAWVDGILSGLQQLPDDALVEAVVDATCIPLVRLLEDEGFRLCDSKFQFLTRVQADQLPPAPATLPEGHSIRDYRESDLQAILNITEKELVQNPMLVTKFKSPWFPLETPSRWYSAWMKDVLRRGALCAVLENPAKAVVGYFAYIQGDDVDGLPMFKGVLTAIRPESRGGRVHLAMQDHLFRKAIHAPIFWLDNTTQISNRPVYRNHVNSGRKPHSISLIFLRGKSAIDED